MQRRFLPLVWAFTLLILSAQGAVSALAANYVVAPLQVNGPEGYSYLGKAIPPMVSSRLFWDSHFEPVANQDSAVQSSFPKNLKEAESFRARYGADYVVFGSVTIMGENASLDVSVLDAQGKQWQKAAQSPVNNLIGGVQSITSAISTEVFKRPAVGSTAQRAVAPMNPDFVVNETQANTVYMNPQIRYQGQESGDRIRSQRLEYQSYGMAVGDISGDGRNEVVLISENSVHAYNMSQGRMELLAEHRFGSSLQPVLVRTIKQGGSALVLVSCYDSTSKDGTTLFFTYANNKFQQVAKEPYYCNVVKLPPMYLPSIVGQRSERNTITRGPVFEVVYQGGQLVRGANVAKLPEEANVFNFVFVPGGQDTGGDYTVVINNEEKMLTFGSSSNRLAKSDEAYSGGVSSIPVVRATVGFNPSKSDLERFYYVPMHMEVVDLNKNGKYEVVLNKPISTAGKVFNNYRTYPQGEIHAVAWDGVGMELVWKTRRIKGTVCDVSIADADNDGVLDLVVNVNSYPGTLGAEQIRAMVLLYPLDLTQQNPNIRDDDDF